MGCAEVMLLVLFNFKPEYKMKLLFSIFKRLSFSISLGCEKVVSNVMDVVEYNIHTIGNDYVEGKYSIRNGNDDMYDDGNMINVPANSSHQVVYLDNCQQGTVNGQPYLMALNNSGYSVALFTPYMKENISIRGNLGNDGSAKQNHGSYEYKGWTGFWKIVRGTLINAGVHHLWVTDAPNATHEVLYDGGDDQDMLSNVIGYNVVYIMLGTKPNYYSSNDVIQQLVEKIYQSFGKKIIIFLNFTNGFFLKFDISNINVNSKRNIQFFRKGKDVYRLANVWQLPSHGL